MRPVTSSWQNVMHPCSIRQSSNGAYCRSNPPSQSARQSPMDGFSGITLATAPRNRHRHTRVLRKPAQVSER